MPLHEADSTDPMLLVGAVVPGGEEDERTMARAVVDEYVRLGFGKDQLFQLFADPWFRMTHRYYQRQGPDGVRALIDSVLAEWGAPTGADRAFAPQPEPDDDSPDDEPGEPDPLVQIRVSPRSGGSHA